MILINAAPVKGTHHFSAFSPVFPPIGLGYLAAVLRQKNIHVHVIDQQIKPDVLHEIALLIPVLKTPYIFGFSVLTAAFQEALLTARALKKSYPGSFIVFGGMHPTAMPEEVLTSGVVDVVIRGEAEQSLVQLVECLNNSLDWSAIPGLSFIRDQQFVHNSDADLMTNLDELPVFPHELFSDNPRYDRGILISSRGCDQQCIFCSNKIISRHKVRYRSARNVASEMELLIRTYGQKHLLFLDDDFMGQEERLFELCHEIQIRGLHLEAKFSFQARCDRVQPQIMQRLYDSGFRTVFFGIESASPAILKESRKGELPADYKKAIQLANAQGYSVQGSFIYGLPGETRQDRIDTLNFALREQFDVVKFNNVVPYPGTQLYKQALKQGLLQLSPDYRNADTLIPLTDGLWRKRKLPYLPENTSQKELRRFIVLSYLAFYLSPARFRSVVHPKDQSIRWLYIRKANGHIAFRKLALLLNLVLVTGVKFLLLLLVPVRENYFLFLLRRKRGSTHA